MRFPEEYHWKQERRMCAGLEPLRMKAFLAPATISQSGRRPVQLQKIKPIILLRFQNPHYVGRGIYLSSLSVLQRGDDALNAGHTPRIGLGTNLMGGTYYW